MKFCCEMLVGGTAGVQVRDPCSLTQDVIDHWRRRFHTCVQPQEDIMNIHCDKN